MSYKVIHHFTDLQDFNHPYRVGDVFPRSGMKVSETRLAELSSNNNKQKKPLIAWEDDASEKDVKSEEVKETEYTKTDINRMSLSDLRELSAVNGIENADKKTGAELKKLLIEHFDL